MAQLKDLVDGSVVGSGSDYIVIQKGKKRIMLEERRIQAGLESVYEQRP